MNSQVYTFYCNPDWRIISQLGQVDAFAATWNFRENSDAQNLKQLKSLATVRSIGSSTRIEGSALTDDEVRALINNQDVSTLEDRDQQEVAGYFEALEVISESFRDIPVTETSIRSLHNILLKHSEKDAWHKGKYKQHSNVVEATHADGKKYIVFRTTEPGFATDDAMRNLVAWYTTAQEVHPVVRVAAFVYDFLSIHPFQDGNGRLSRLLATWLLLREGYAWIEYISFEHEIENEKAEYYKVLMDCQSNRPGEDIYTWVHFFLRCMNNIQNLLLEKLEQKGLTSQLSVREKKIVAFVDSHQGCRSGQVSKSLAIPLPTVKRIVAELASKKVLIKHGIGAGTNYTVQTQSSLKKDLVLKLTTYQRHKEFLFTSRTAFVEIKQFILTPLFKWITPEDWNSELINEALHLEVTCKTRSGITFKQAYRINAYRNPNLFNPVFILAMPINLPLGLMEKFIPANEYPLTATIELVGAVKDFKFDLLVVYDECV